MASEPKQLSSRRSQSGVVLMVALIVLIALTLAGLALMRSVDTTTIIAGNLSFQQAATHSGDGGIETAISWIEGNPLLLVADNATNAYAANGLNTSVAPAKAATQSWEAYWNTWWAGRAVTAGQDAAGNTVSRVIDRLCQNAGSPTGGANCSASPVISSATGNAEEGGEIPVDAPSQVYYRITTRIQGPRNSVSYAQAVIAR